MFRVPDILCLLIFVCLSQHSTPVFAGGNKEIEDTHCQPVQAVCDVVDGYVFEKKGWSKDRFIIKHKGDRHGLFVIWVVHLDDLRRTSSLGGKSFALHVDSKKLSVVRELGFQ
jgi:hypothetical protein